MLRSTIETKKSCMSCVICKCRKVKKEDILRVAEEKGFHAIAKETGAGTACGRCNDDIEKVIDEKLSFDQPKVPVFQFDREAIKAIRGVPAMYLMTVASCVSTPAERFMIHTMEEAKAHITDPELLMEAENFIKEESQHIAAHEVLNAILLEEIYPNVTFLRKLYEGFFQSFYGLPLKVKMAIAATYEFAADSIFSSFFETYFETGPVYHHDAQVNQLMSQSGVADLFVWHGAAEFDHRHVAFDISEHLGVKYSDRLKGFWCVWIDLWRRQAPALLELQAKNHTDGLLDFLNKALINPGMVRKFFSKVTRCLLPGFNPNKISYGFLPKLSEIASRLS